MQRDHQVWSLGDEDDELDNKRKRGKICLLARKGSNSVDGWFDMKKNYCYMDREGTLNIMEQVKLMIQSNDYNIHDYKPCLEKLTKTFVDILTNYNKAFRSEKHSDPRVVSLERKTRS